MYKDRNKVNRKRENKEINVKRQKEKIEKYKFIQKKEKRWTQKESKRKQTDKCRHRKREMKVKGIVGSSREGGLFDASKRAFQIYFIGEVRMTQFNNHQILKPTKKQCSRSKQIINGTILYSYWCSYPKQRIFVR